MDREDVRIAMWMYTTGVRGQAEGGREDKDGERSEEKLTIENKELRS